MTRASGVWRAAPRPPKLGSTRVESSATVIDPSTTAVTILRPDHSPVNRDRYGACTA